MTTICLQAGHQLIQQNCDRLLAQGTGASGEITWTPLMRAKVGSILVHHGFTVHQADANLNCLPPGPVHGPYDLTLCLHYQSWNGKAAGAGGNSGFGVFLPDPSVDQSTTRSTVLARAIAKTYAARTKLANYSSPRLGLNTATWENPNTLFYYLWRTQQGPLALIECGVGAAGAPDHALLYAHADLVASAIAEGVCVAFGKVWAPPAPAPVPVPIPVPVPVPPQPPVPEPPPVVPPVVVPDPPVLVVVPDPAPEAPPGRWAALIAWIKRILGIA